MCEKREIDIFDNFSDYKIPFVINPKLWKRIDNELIKCIREEWNEVKFLDENRQLSSQLNNIPNDKGGLYIFIAKTDIIPASHIYIMYIGRAKITQSQNLRKRCKEYGNAKRPKIKRMVQSWGEHLYIRYYPMIDNNKIDDLEKELINNIIPPFNDEIPDKETRDKVKAFF